MKQSKQSNGTIGGLGLPIRIPAPEIEGVPEAFRPFVEISMKMQSEFMELWGHRSRAWLEWPEDYSNCKTMEDLTSAQSDYLARLQHDYAHFMNGILRDTMIEQDEFEEQVEDEKLQPQTGATRREAA